MVSCFVKRCSNQSGLSKCVSYNKLPCKKIKDKRDAWIKVMSRSVLHKPFHVCSVYSMEDSFDESQELKGLLLGIKSKYLLKPDAFPPYPRIEKSLRKQGHPI